MCGMDSSHDLAVVAAVMILVKCSHILASCGMEEEMLRILFVCE
jgi:hypothetical protein